MKIACFWRCLSTDFFENLVTSTDGISKDVKQILDVSVMFKWCFLPIDVLFNGGVPFCDRSFPLRFFSIRTEKKMTYNLLKLFMKFRSRDFIFQSISQTPASASTLSRQLACLFTHLSDNHLYKSFFYWGNQYNTTKRTCEQIYSWFPACLQFFSNQFVKGVSTHKWKFSDPIVYTMNLSICMVESDTGG